MGILRRIWVDLPYNVTDARMIRANGVPPSQARSTSSACPQGTFRAIAQLVRRGPEGLTRQRRSAVNARDTVPGSARFLCRGPSCGRGLVVAIVREFRVTDAQDFFVAGSGAGGVQLSRIRLFSLSRTGTFFLVARFFFDFTCVFLVARNCFFLYNRAFFWGGP